jgi:hypothetical protein
MKYIDLKESSFLLFSLLFSLLLVGVSFSYPEDSSEFPRFLSLVLLGLSLAMSVASVRSGRLKEGKGSSFRALAERMKIPAAVFLGVSLYVASIEIFGFYSSTPVFMAGGMFAAGSRRYGTIALTTLLFLALVYALFSYSLGLRLPGGIVFE